MTWICRTWWITFKKRCSHWPFPLKWLLLSVEVFKLITDSLLDASETKARNRSLFSLFFCLSEGFHRRLHATYSSCSLWVTSCETALPSAHAGTFMSLGFPTGEALTGRMPSTDQHYVSKYTPDFTFHSSFFFSPQFKCCGWNNYTDWSWNLYFNCTHDNPSSERCGVPYSCCTPVPGEVSLSLFSLLTYTTCTN